MSNSTINNSIVAKAGLWYTICNFVFKGMAFITTPIFARLLTKEELGNFSNYSSWVGILLVITSLDLSQSIIRSKLEHESDMDCYIWSILALSTIWTLALYIVVCVAMPFFSGLFDMQPKYVHIMFLTLLASPPYLMMITKNRAFYKYKTFVAMTGIMAVSGISLSLLLVVIMDDKLAGRIIGYYVPQIAIGFVLFIILATKGKRIKTDYWKYACKIMLPLVPHVLSLYLLSSSDKIIITRLCGASYTAVYSIAYSAYHISTILFDSMNKAWAPWLLDNLHRKNYETILNTSRKYIGLFMIFIICILLLIPEIILVLGGRNYMGAVYCLPPLIVSCLFQFIYTMYVNVEFYEKKTIGVSIATIIATILNILLNIIFIPMYPDNSYVIAAYTTLVGYIVLFVLHYFIVKRMRMTFVYDTRFIIVILVITSAFAGIMNLLYRTTIIRYCIFAGFGCGLIAVGLKFKAEIVRLFKKERA